MTEEEVLAKTVKVGLPTYGTHEDRLERLYRNNILPRPEADDRHEIEKQLDGIPIGTILKVNTGPYVAKRGRPAKVKK